MKNLVAPVIGVAVNIAALTVAMQVQRQVTRAMMGEQIVLQEAYGNAGAQYVQAAKGLQDIALLRKEEVAMINYETRSTEILTEAHLEELRAELKEIVTKKNAAKASRDKAVALKEEQQRLSEVHEAILANMALEDRAGSNRERLMNDRAAGVARALNQEKRAASEMRKQAEKEFRISNEIAESMHEQSRIEAKRIDDANAKMAAQQARLYGLTGAFMALGSVMMMTAKTEKQMRAGVILTTGAMAAMAAVQLTQGLRALFAVKAEESLIKTMLAANTTMWEKTLALEINTGALARNTAAELANTVAVGEKGIMVTTVGSGKNSAGILALAKNLKYLVGTFAALAVAYTIMQEISEYIGKRAANNIEKFTANTDNAAYSTEKLVETLEAQEWTTKNVATAIEKQTTVVEDAMRIGGKRGQEEVDKALELLGIYREIQNILDNHVGSKQLFTEEQETGINKIFDEMEALDAMTDKYGDLTKRGLASYNEEILAMGRPSLIGQFGARQAYGFSSAVIDQKPLTELYMEHHDSLQDLIQTYPQLDRLIEKTGATTKEEFLDVLEQTPDLWDEFFGVTSDGMQNIASDLDTITGSMYEFNNAREELFYGMAASNVTGDLVRQVVNRGVENLIATTEVIMTNNFNGMTTEAAAEEILNAIERGAGTRGINLAVVQD